MFKNKNITENQKALKSLMNVNAGKIIFECELPDFLHKMSVNDKLAWLEGMDMNILDYAVVKMMLEQNVQANEVIIVEIHLPQD